MTDRVKALTVHLTHDIRTDDIESLIIAIRQLKCVASVDKHIVTGVDHMARERIKHDTWKKFHKFWKGLYE